MDPVDDFAMHPPLTPPESHHLRAAEGWLGLGDYAAALEEFKRISPELAEHPDVLDVGWQILAHAKNWDACVDVGWAIIKAVPGRAEGWVYRSFALHELKRTEEAYEKLARVADRFPDAWAVPYHLACYCTQLGRCDEAREWLKKAVTINPKVIPKANIHDPDPNAVWHCPAIR